MSNQPDHANPERWVVEHGDALYRYAFLRLRDKFAAEDAVQETLLSAWKARDNFQGRSAERTWLTGILKHKIIDYIRKSARESTSKDLELLAENADDSFDRKGRWKVRPAEWITNPSKAFERAEFWEKLHGCIAALPDRHRQIFVLRELDGMEAEELCKIAGVSTTNLWVLLYRARMQLRTCLEINWLGKTENEVS